MTEKFGLLGTVPQMSLPSNEFIDSFFFLIYLTTSVRTRECLQMNVLSQVGRILFFLISDLKPQP